MIITVKKKLVADDNKAIWQFLEGFNYIPYQQFPEYSIIEGLKTTHFIGEEHNKVIGWAQVVEKKNILAVIEFGPLGQTEGVVQELLLFIARYYKSRFFLMLRWMPYCYREDVYRRITTAVAGRFRFLDAEPESYWSSKRIPLQNDAAAILKSFSENHRRAIKKAGMQGLVYRVVQEPEVDCFTADFIEMYRNRGLPVHARDTASSFKRLYSYLRRSGSGFFTGAFHENTLLGGVIIIYQGATAFYHRGFINHEQRQLPINHGVFYSAMLKAKADGMEWFDFGGYAVDTNDEQLININKFKDGFRGELVRFPPTKTIELWRLARVMARLLKHRKRVTLQG